MPIDSFLWFQKCFSLLLEIRHIVFSKNVVLNEKRWQNKKR